MIQAPPRWLGAKLSGLQLNEVITGAFREIVQFLFVFSYIVYVLFS